MTTFAPQLTARRSTIAIVLALTAMLAFAVPAIPAFHIENRDLFDLLGAKYVVTQPGESLVTGWQPLAFDESPRSYNLFGGGMQTLPPQRLFKSPTAMPRAFVVRSAVKEEADESGVYRQLTRMDVRNSAIVADWDMTADPMPIADREPGSVAILEYHPNRVTFSLDGHSAGLLVLTDPWYPGWICTVDGVQSKVWRTDYAFRGVMVHEGAKEVVFTFEPKSYRIGRTVTFATFGVLVLTALISPARWLVRRKRAR